MAVTHPNPVRQAVADLVVDRLDLGSTNVAGQLEIQTSGGAEVATLALSNPAFGAASASGVATANAISDDADATGGTAAQFVLQDRDETDTIEGSVGGTGSGADIELSNTVIPANARVQITALSYTAMP